jgi:hypothetical protein
MSPSLNGRVGAASLRFAVPNEIFRHVWSPGVKCIFRQLIGAVPIAGRRAVVDISGIIRCNCRTDRAHSGSNSNPERGVRDPEASGHHRFSWDVGSVDEIGAGVMRTLDKATIEGVQTRSYDGRCRECRAETQLNRQNSQAQDTLGRKGTGRKLRQVGCI